MWSGDSYFVNICFLFLQTTFSVDHELTTLFMQPQIGGIGKGFDSDKLYIVCEGTVLCNIPHQSIVGSIVALLSSFYILNMALKTAKPYCLSISFPGLFPLKLRRAPASISKGKALGTRLIVFLKASFNGDKQRPHFAECQYPIYDISDL